MAADLSADSSLGKPLVARRSFDEDARFDITAMVDLVFMMNIFFLVTWVGAALAEVDLPPARHCVAADPETSVIVTVLGGESQSLEVFLGDGRSGPPMVNPSEIEEKVQAAAQAGAREGKDTILIKAEKGVRLRDVARIAASAVATEGMKLRLAVMEKE